MKDDWSLCVGVGSFVPDSRLHPLPGAIGDAGRIHAWLTDKTSGGRVPDTQAKLIQSPREQNDDSTHPRLHVVEDFLRSLYRRAEERSHAGEGFRLGRRLWMFFSGHGLGFPSPDGRSVGDTGLLMADARPEFDLPHVAGLEWATLFASSRAFDEVVLFMDCCRTNAVRTPLHRPSVRRRKPAGAGGALIGAFGAQPNTATYEVLIDGERRGQFAYQLEQLLRSPPRPSMSTREFLDELQVRFAALDRTALHPGDDFEMFEPPAPAAVIVKKSARVFLAHDHAAIDLATDLQVTLQGLGLEVALPLAGGASSRPLEAAAKFDGLVVACELSEPDVGRLVARVGERRMLVLASEKGREGCPPGVRVMHPEPGGTRDLLSIAMRIRDVFDSEAGKVVVKASSPLAKVELWNGAGRMVHRGFGSVEFDGAAEGSYFARASLGGVYYETSIPMGLLGDRVVDLPIEVPSLTQDARVEGQPVDDLERPRDVRAVDVGGGQTMVVSLPRVAGWRAETFVVDPRVNGSLSIRLVPEGHPPWTPYATDRLREELRLAAGAPGWEAGLLSADDLTADPVAALLAASLLLRSGREGYRDFIDVAARVLGDSDVDVKLLRGDDGVIAMPPLLSLPWHYRLHQGTLRVAPDSDADAITGRILGAAPWMAWHETESPQSSWLSGLAQAMWPGWDRHPEPELVTSDFTFAAASYGAPLDAIERRNYKSPPVASLVKHESAAFIAATNDQLPAALAVAFARRESRKWSHIQVLSLSDEGLKNLVSAGRTGDELVAARDAAEEQLRRILAVTAEVVEFHRYDGLVVDGVRGFASLWDWKNKHGMVHWSPIRAGKDVRSDPSKDEVWTETEPPLNYRRVATAFDELKLT